MIPLLLAAATAAASPGKVETFRDWVVGCDNVRRCEAQALMPPARIDRGALLIAGRAAGAEAVPAVRIVPRGIGLPAALAIDGRRLPVALRRVDEAAEVTGDATPLLRAAAAGTRLTLLDARGRVMAEVSLAGASAALRRMDAAQGRAGTVTAIVGRGPRPASAVPPAPPVPRFASPRVPRLPPAVPTAAELAAMRRLGRCTGDQGTPSGGQSHRLDAQTTLVLVPCGSGAYNLNAMPFLIDERAKGSQRIRVAPFQFPTGFAAERTPMLTNAGWDAGTLSSFARGRGLGDCGARTLYRWDGARFRTVEERVMGECRGSTEFIRTWVAEAR